MVHVVFPVLHFQKLIRLPATEMEMRKLHMGTMSYGWDAMDEIARQVSLAFSNSNNAGEYLRLCHLPDRMLTQIRVAGKRQSSMSGGINTMVGRGRRDMSSRVRDAVLALAVCHNVCERKKLVTL
jgi:phospholipid-translocating ATPase